MTETPGPHPRNRSLSAEKVGEISVVLAFAALDAGLDRRAIVASWARVGEMMPLALDLASNAIEARPGLSDTLAARIQDLIAVDRDREQQQDGAKQ